MKFLELIEETEMCEIDSSLLNSRTLRKELYSWRRGRGGCGPVGRNPFAGWFAETTRAAGSICCCISQIGLLDGSRQLCFPSTCCGRVLDAALQVRHQQRHRTSSCTVDLLTRCHCLCSSSGAFLILTCINCWYLISMVGSSRVPRVEYSLQ